MKRPSKYADLTPDLIETECKLPPVYARTLDLITDFHKYVCKTYGQVSFAKFLERAMDTAADPAFLEAYPQYDPDFKKRLNSSVGKSRKGKEGVGTPSV